MTDSRRGSELKADSSTWRTVVQVCRIALREAGTLIRLAALVGVTVPALLASPPGAYLQAHIGIDPPVTMKPVTALVLAALSTLLWLVVVLGKATWKYESQLSAGIKVDFVPEGGGLVISPAKQKDAHGNVLAEFRVVYIRISVTARALKAARDCEAYLTNVETVDGSGDLRPTIFRDPLQLPWSLIGVRQIRIPHLVRRHVDVLTTENEAGKLQLPNGILWPLTLRRLLSAAGTYRLTVIVVGEELSERIVIDVDWNGKADDIRARKVG